MPKTCPVCATVYPDSDAFCPKDGTTLRSDEGDGSLVGSVIADRYLVSKLLGEGGMGQVYLAGHVRLPQQAAIKVLHASMLKDAGAVSRFNREAANAARIEHERVARVFDFGETGSGQVYLAMEFVPGKTLGELLEESSGRLPATRVANIIYQVAEGLEAAHKISIVHRDLKPDNVLVITDENGVDRCKVVDFGIAKAFDDSDSGKTQLTQAGAIIGTPEFMSPEQVLGEQLDARSDVYALAVVGYQLFTGALPFVATTPERSLTARLISDPQTLHDAAPDIDWPEELQAAFDKAFAREPEERSATAVEFAEAVVMAVEEWTGTGVLRGRTPLSTAALGTPAGGSLAATAKSPGGGSASATRGATSTRSAASAAAGAADVPAKRGSGMLVGGAVALLLAVAGGAYVMMGGGDAESATPAAAVAEAGTPAATDAGEPASPSDVPGAGGTTEAQGSNPPVAGGGTAAPATAAAGASSAPATATPPTGAVNRPAAGGNTAAAANTPPASNSPGTPSGSAAPAAGAAGRTDADAARTELSALVDQVQNSESEAVARAAIPRFQALLGRFTTPADSGAVYLQLTLTHGALGNTPGKCASYRSFKRLAVTQSLQTMVLNLEGGGAVSDCLF